MDAVCTTPGLVWMLLAAMLAPGALAQYARGWRTTELCRTRDLSPYNARRYPTDDDVTHLWLDECKLTEINPNDFDGLPNLEKIYIYENEITGAYKATFPAGTKLKTIDLSKNKIEYLHPDVFIPVTELNELYLHYNKIRYIPESIFDENVNLKRVTLYRNRISYLPTGFVVNLKKSGVSVEHFYFDSNPWHCACLMELIEDVKRAGVSHYKVDEYGEYDGNEPGCVYIGRYPCRRHAPSGLLALATRSVNHRT